MVVPPGAAEFLNAGVVTFVMLSVLDDPESVNVVMAGVPGATGGTSKVTVLSVLVEAVLLKPAPSCAALAPTVAITVQVLVMPLTATL